VPKHPKQSSVKSTVINGLRMMAASGYMDRIAEINPDAVILDGYNHAIIGIATRFGTEPILCYSTAKIIETLMREGMTEEEAVEFFDFNIIGGWFGDGTPIFLDQ
jgi:hypothetical protein